MAAPRISVVIPACNEESFLPRWLDSLKKQTFRDFEIIVVAGRQAASKHQGNTIGESE